MGGMAQHDIVVIHQLQPPRPWMAVDVGVIFAQIVRLYPRENVLSKERLPSTPPQHAINLNRKKNRQTERNIMLQMCKQWHSYLLLLKQSMFSDDIGAPPMSPSSARRVNCFVHCLTTMCSTLCSTGVVVAFSLLQDLFGRSHQK